MGRETWHLYSYIMIDDVTRFRYFYLLQTKDDALDYFKIYKFEVENQLEGRSTILGQIVVESIFTNIDEFGEEHSIIHERTPP